MPPKLRPQPPKKPPPVYLRFDEPTAKRKPQPRWAANGKPTVRPPATKGRAAVSAPAPDTDIPSFIGAASKKRKLQLAKDRGLAGHEAGGGPQWHRPRAGWDQPATPAPSHGQGHGAYSSAAHSRFVPRAFNGAPRPSGYPAPAKPTSVATGSTALWITLPPDAPFLEQGLPELAPLVSYSSELQSMLSMSQSILHELIGEVASTVTITHDPDWSALPEVGEATQATTGEEQSICVATCNEYYLWAVGTGKKWKQREQAAKLALCVALAANTDAVDLLMAQYPDFLALCERSNIITGGNGKGQHQGPGARKAPDAMRAPQQLRATHWKASRAQAAPVEGPGVAAESETAAEEKLPRDAPVWINLSPMDMPEQLQAMSDSALAIATDGKGKKGLYSCAPRVLEQLLDDAEQEVQYFDDANWEQFPQVGQALKSMATAEECLTVAVCSTKDVWAVGCGMKGTNRYAAAKAAMATSLGLQALEMGEDPDLTEFSALLDFMEEARVARA